VHAKGCGYRHLQIRPRNIARAPWPHGRGRGAELDINTVTDLVPAPHAVWRDGDAWLGGGTWLFSEPQPATTRLLDLASYNWQPITETDDGLEIAATCTLAELARWRPEPARARDWPAARTLPRQCTDALLGSFKVQNVATVGGNICLSLPAGPMIALGAALDGVATILGPGRATRQVPVSRFVTGERRNVLRPGELLRSVFLPASALGRRAACRQASLSRAGRSAVLLIATLARGGETLLTVTAATPHPVQVRFPVFPPPNDSAAILDSIVTTSTGYLDDAHGSALWRRAMTLHAAADVLAELSGRKAAP
jgi:CO/xanthine dehydrogenase FAD-binding subunit